jgi:hypothetical protein
MHLIRVICPPFNWYNYFHPDDCLSILSQAKLHDSLALKEPPMAYKIKIWVKNIFCNIKHQPTPQDQ